MRIVRVILKKKGQLGKRELPTLKLINVTRNHLNVGNQCSGRPDTYSFFLYPITASNLTLSFRFTSARKRSGRILSSIIKKRIEDGTKIIFSSVRIPFISLFTTCSGSRVGPRLVLGFLMKPVFMKFGQRHVVLTPVLSKAASSSVKAL